MRWSQRHGPRRRDSEETPDVWCGCSLRGSVAQRHRLRTVTDQQPHQEGVVRPPSGPATAHGVSSSKTGSHTAEKVLDTASNATSQDFCKRLKGLKVSKTTSIPTTSPPTTPPTTSPPATPPTTSPPATPPTTSP